MLPSLSKVIPDLYEVVFCPKDEKGGSCKVPDWMSVVVDLSHLLVCFNSSANFLIYMVGGEKFRWASEPAPNLSDVWENVWHEARSR